MDKNELNELFEDVIAEYRQAARDHVQEYSGDATEEKAGLRKINRKIATFRRRFTQITKEG